MNTSPTYLTNLDRCHPADALSPDPKRHTWRTVPYETETLSGTMLLAGDETAAPEITCTIENQGWHCIYLGLYPEGGSSTVQVRLSDDLAAVAIDADQGRDYAHSQERHGLCEVYWKAADLSGQDLHLSQVCTQVGSSAEAAAVRCARAKVAYVKLVPLGEQEVDALQADRRNDENRRLFAHNDAHGPLFLWGVDRAEEIRREIEPYRHTDFSRLYWEMGGGDLLFHLGEQGRLPTCDGREDFERQGDRLHAESWRTLRDKGLDPLQVALEHAREVGLEFHASYRVAGFHYPVPFDQWNDGGLYGRRPDLRAVEKDGSSAPRISYAYPEVRHLVVDILAEVARKHPVDGIALLYNRRPPLIAYEPPLVVGFTEEFDEDPRTLPDDDERWLRYRCIALTELARELRRELDVIAEKEGRDKRIHVSICVSNRQENLRHGLDLESLVKEELIDTLIPYTSAPNLDSTAEAWRDLDEVAYFVALCRDTSCALALNLMPRHISPEAYRRKATTLYNAAVERFFFWDSAGSSGRANFGPAWETLRRLGHREEIVNGMDAGEPVLVPDLIALRRLGDYDLSYQTPG